MLRERKKRERENPPVPRKTAVPEGEGRIGRGKGELMEARI